jgi:thiol-disulfide isomerase/thioredoxin
MKLDKAKIRKEIKEWAIFLVAIAILYFSGLYTEIAGGLQRIVLATGLRDASVEKANFGDADFNFALQPLDTAQPAFLFADLKGKTIFLNFWATWCPPCIAEMPSIQALYDKAKQENIVFVMIATNDEQEKVQKFIQRKGYTFPIYFLKDNYLPTIFQSKAIPTTFVISPAGNIVFKHEGTANYDTEQFIALLGEVR